MEKVLIRGGITIFRRSFCLTVPKYFIGEHFGVSEKLFYRKFSCIGGGRGITVLSKIFVSQDRNEKLCKGSLLFSGNFLVSKKNLWKRGGLSRFSVEIFMSHSAENFRKRILLFLRNFLVSKSFMDEKGGITFFRRKVLVSQCRKNSWASLQIFRKFGASEKFMHNRGYHKFPSKIYCLTVLKNFVEPFSVSLISGIKKC